jgi:hypothetical protein
MCWNTRLVFTWNLDFHYSSHSINADRPSAASAAQIMYEANMPLRNFHLAHEHAVHTGGLLSLVELNYLCSVAGLIETSNAL